MRSVISAGLSAALLATSATALDAIGINGQEFVVGTSGNRFQLIGLDYQPGGSSGYDPTSGKDPLSDPDICRRDAAVMQMVGSNTLRVYNLDPNVNHDQCASIFNAAGIYMVIDVNDPLPNGSINEDNPGNSYNSVYLNRTFAIVDNFRNYPNTLAFFSANELIHKDGSFSKNPPYVRAVTRDLHQYMRARGGRVIPVGYSAADVRDVLADTLSYVSCAIDGENANESKSDFIGVNGYSWCGDVTDWTQGQYDQLANIFGKSTIPVFFSEYGCNKVMPRSFNEVGTIYNGQQMPSFSGGLAYEYTMEDNDYGFVNVTDAKTLTLLKDLETISAKWAAIDQNYLTTANNSATALTPPACSSSLITGGKISTSFKLPNQPSGVADMIKNGVGGVQGKLVDVSLTLPSDMKVTWENGTQAQLQLNQKSSSNDLGSTTGASAPGGTGSSGSGGSNGSSGSSGSHSTSHAGVERITPAAQAGIFVAGLTYFLSML